MRPDLWADSAVSIFAALGLLIVLRRIFAAGRDPLAARFRLALGLLAALMLVRVAAWTTGFTPLTGLTVAIAGAVPLAAVILTEGLLRRHAPPALKWLALLGALAFVLAAVLPASVLPAPVRGLALMVFQLGVLTATGLVVLTRDRATLTAEENRVLDRMLVLLALILPLLVGDHRAAGLNLPIRTAPVAILTLAWLSLGLGHATSTPGTLALGFAGLLGLAGAVALALWGVADLPPRALVQAGGVVLCALLLLAISLDAHALQAEARADTILSHLAHGALDTPETFLAALDGRSGVKGSVLLTPTDLTDFDLPRLSALFARHPVLSAARIRSLPPGRWDTADREQADWLFTRFESSHALLVRPAPLSLLMLARPAVGGAELAELELLALQRMAALVARAEVAQPKP